MREWKYFFTPRRLRGGGCERDSGRGGWSVSDDVWDFATPQKFALRIFTPPPQAAEGEIPAFAGMEYGEGMERWGNGSIFLPPAACGGGCERDSGRGGWSVSDDVWDFATPQKFALRIFTPPRKRRRVRFRLSPEWKCGYWGGTGNACTAPLITCRGKPLPAFFATPESHALPLRCRCRRRQFSASPSGRCRCRSRSHQCSLRR